MVSNTAPIVPISGDQAGSDAAMQRQWRISLHLSSFGSAIETFLGQAGFDRGPWLAVAFASGITLWFVLDGPQQWISALVIAAMAAGLANILWRKKSSHTHIQMALTGFLLMAAAGLAMIWVRSELVGAAPISHTIVGEYDARILDRIEQPAHDRVRLILAMRAETAARAMKVRVNLPDRNDSPALVEGAIIRLKARLMPPASPMLPGGYDFARAAWFSGFAATGSVIGPVRLISPATSNGSAIASIQRHLSEHIRKALGGSPGTIAAAFASGDRGAIAQADDDAMRDAGLTHLLSISGLHVSAVVAAAYLVSIKLLALWQWLALRMRLPLAAAGIAALAGIGYTLLTGAEVPTIRSCVAAVLVLIALALGREALSLRMVAVAAIFVMLLWPETLAGPSFQMSFSAVVAIVALHSSEPVRSFLAAREESWFTRSARRALMLLATGVVIELALMPIGLFHFHRAGVYGALANVVAIPLTTFVTMPLIAFALILDVIGMGAPAWWLVGKSLELLLAIAHWTASQPGAVNRIPSMEWGAFGLFVIGGLWLALWRGRARLLGFLPAAIATIWTVLTPAPDLLISGDGRHLAIIGEGPRPLFLRGTNTSYAGETLQELSGAAGIPLLLADWPGARCSKDFCSVTLQRGGRAWHLLVARSKILVPERALAAACDRADIVIADRWLPRSCSPRWLKADRRMLNETGGLAIRLDRLAIRSVADSQGHHGWWRGWRPREDGKKAYRQ